MDSLAEPSSSAQVDSFSPCNMTAGLRGSIVSGLIGMGVVAAIRFTQNVLLPKMGVSQRNAHVLFI